MVNSNRGYSKPLYVIVHRSQIESTSNYYRNMIACMESGEIPYPGASKEVFEIGLRETEAVLGEIERLVEEEDTLYVDGSPYEIILPNIDKRRQLLVCGGLFRLNSGYELCVDKHIEVLKGAGYCANVYSSATLAATPDDRRIQLSKAQSVFKNF